MMLEKNKTYYYIGVGNKDLYNHSIIKIQYVEDVNNHSVYLCEDDFGNSFKTYDFNLSEVRGPANRLIRNILKTKKLIPDGIKTFPSFIGGRYVGDL